MNPVIVTPSYINSKERYEYAKKSYESLRYLGEYEHIVVNDINPLFKRMPKILSQNLRSFTYINAAKQIYTGHNVKIIERNKGGSASALLDAIRYAKKQMGAEYVFINLDDHIYIPLMKKLFQYGIHALENTKDLLMLRFSGYPLIYSNKKTPINVFNDVVAFDNIELKRTVMSDYTLWTSPFNTDSINGDYWPIALWFCIYKIELLEHVLSSCNLSKYHSLGLVESYYKRPDNWKELLKGIRGQFGYINMQYGGFEMHRNKNWEVLINKLNEQVR